MLRYSLSSRWVAWHLFCLVVVVLLIAAGVWQWNVAMANVNDLGEPEVSVRNLVYAIQWWIFAAFAAWFWFRYLRDQRDAEMTDLREQVSSAPGEQIAAETPNRISLDGSATQRRDRARAIRQQNAAIDGTEGESSE